MNQVHQPMLDLTNIQPMVIDSAKPIAISQTPKTICSVSFYPKTSLPCVHSNKMPSLDSSHWTCEACGVFISSVKSNPYFYALGWSYWSKRKGA